MILADKIINERKKNGWSQEELAEKLNVSRQAVSKWEGAQSIPDLQKIVAMSALFNVSTDYLIKDELDEKDTAPSTLTLTEDSEPVRRVSLEEASIYVNLRKETAPLTALGVALCILSPVLLILLAGFGDSGVLGITETAAVAVGLPALFLLIACGVFLFLKVSARCEDFEFLEKEQFETAYGVDGYVNREKTQFKEKRAEFLSIGVVLCILSAVPLIICAVIGLPDYVLVAMTSLLLAIVAVGVYLIVKVSCVNEAFNVLLQREEYTPQEKKTSKKLGSFSGIYWCVITAVYLALGFTKNLWDKAWILFAVGGVLYAAAYAIAKAVVNSRDRER